MKVSKLLMIVLSVIVLMACKREGCTDQNADNYDKKAKNDDGSCVYNGVNPNDPNNPNNPGGGTTGPGGEELPIRLTGTETGSRTISDISTNSNVVEYYIDNTWKIDAPVTIEPGVRIEMRPGGKIEILANGFLNATGTASNKITFSGPSTGAQEWHNIVFFSNNPNNKLIHCNISHGGEGSWMSGSVSLKESARLIMQNTTITKANDYGMHLHKNSVLDNFHSNHIAESVKAPILVASLKQTAQLDNTTSFNNNTLSYIEVGGGNIDVNTVVPKLQIPYTIASSFNIVSGHTEISAGVKLIMMANIGIAIEENGSFALQGTSGAGVTVEGKFNSLGYWRGITYHSNNPQNNMSYATIKHGSNYDWGDAVVNLKSNSQLSMDNTHIAMGSNIALEVEPSATFIDNGNNTHADCVNGGGDMP